MEVPTSYYQLHRAHPTALGWIFMGDLHPRWDFTLHVEQPNALLLSAGKSEPAQTKFPRSQCHVAARDKMKKKKRWRKKWQTEGGRCEKAAGQLAQSDLVERWL